MAIAMMERSKNKKLSAMDSVHHGVIQCSDNVPPNYICRGISTNVCPE